MPVDVYNHKHQQELIMEQLLAIGAAMNELRTRRNDRSLGSRIEAGKIQMVKTTYAKKGKSTVEPASDWMPVASFVAYLNSI